MDMDPQRIELDLARRQIEGLQLRLSEVLDHNGELEQRLHHTRDLAWFLGTLTAVLIGVFLVEYVL